MPDINLLPEDLKKKINNQHIKSIVSNAGFSGISGCGLFLHHCQSAVVVLAEI